MTSTTHASVTITACTIMPSWTLQIKKPEKGVAVYVPDSSPWEAEWRRLLAQPVQTSGAK